MLNEVLPQPPKVDWNGDRRVNEADSWIELRNTRREAISLAGWRLGYGPASEASSNSRNNLQRLTYYQFPARSRLEAGEIVVIYGRESGLELGASGVLVLMSPDGAVVDRVTYRGVGPDQSLSRDLQGGWTDSLPPTPGAANLIPRLRELRPTRRP